MLKFKFDGHSGAILNITKKREIAQLITTKIFEIEDSFPIMKESVFDKRKIISKSASIRFPLFMIYLYCLDCAKRLS